MIGLDGAPFFVTVRGYTRVIAGRVSVGLGIAGCTIYLGSSLKFLPRLRPFPFTLFFLVAETARLFVTPLVLAAGENELEPEVKPNAAPSLRTTLRR